MKTIFLACALPLLLAGCAATGGYYSSYPGNFYGPGPYYYDDSPSLDLAYYGGYGHRNDGYGNRHDYHHYDTNFRRNTTLAHSSYRSGGAHYAAMASRGHSAGASHSAASSMHR